MNLFQIMLLVVFFAHGCQASELDQQPTNDCPKRKSVCLNMIVKNEKDVIRRCLSSVLPFIDYWVIVDTGSTDGTQQLIREFMSKNNIVGELHERPWVNFEHNREEALVLAKNKGDYLLFIDADDEITYPNDYKLPHLIYDLYLLEAYAANMRYSIIFMAKSSQDLHWRYPIHEYLEAKDAKVGAILGRIKYVYHHDGSRSKDPNTARSDIRMLKECLAKDPESSRMIIFLAQTYRTINEIQLALKYYKKRIELGGNEEEVFWSLLQTANIQRELKYDHSIVEEIYKQASNLLPQRPEPIFHLANIAINDGDYQKGYEIARSGLNMPSPPSTFYVEELSCNAIIYEFAICAFMLGKYDRCLKACNKILKENKLPKEFLIEANNLRKSALKKKSDLEVFRTLDTYYPQ